MKSPRPRRSRRLVLWALVLGLMAAVVYVPLQQRRQSRETARLERVRDGLRAELAQLLKADRHLSRAPPGGALIGAPAPFSARLAHQLVDGLLERTEIRLTNLEVRKRGRVNVKALLLKMTPGEYALDVRVTEIQGRLDADEPEIHYEDDRARLKIPVRIREGRGQARIRFQWESRGLAGIACGDIDVTERVSGRVWSHPYPVEGEIELSVVESTVIATPRVAELGIRLYVEPSKASWAAVDRLLASQGLGCRTALKLVDVPKALQEVLGRGLKVKIPGRTFTPLRLPAGFRDSVTMEGTTYRLKVEPRGLGASQDILWYGADLTAQVRGTEAGVPVRELPAARPVPLGDDPGSVLPAEQPGLETPVANSADPSAESGAESVPLDRPGQ